MGNDSADLDSCTTAIAIAELFNQHPIIMADHLIKRPDLEKHKVVPILNIERSDLHLKKEVMEWFTMMHIDPANVLCM